MWMLSKHHFMWGRLDWRPETLEGKTTVTVHEKLEERRSSAIAATLSGARIESIALGAARAVLAQVGENGEIAGSFGGAWGAFEHPEALIGVAVLTISKSPRGRFCVAVMRARRNLGVGGELLETLVVEAAQRGLRTLTCTHPAADPAPQRLVNSLGLKAARRVHDKTAVMVLLVHSSMSNDH